MTPLRQIFADFREAGSIETLVHLDSAIDQRTFLTRGGDLLAVLKASPKDAGCLEPDAIDERARRFEGALRTLDESYRLRQYLIKRPFAGLPRHDYKNPVVDRLETARADYVASRAEELFALDVYFVVAYTGWRAEDTWRARWTSWVTDPRRALRSALSERATVATLEAGLAQARDRLAQKVDNLVVQLQDVLPLTVLEIDDAFRFFRRLLNYAPAKSEVGTLKHPNAIGFQAADSALECYRDHLRLDDYYVQVLSLKEPPAQTFANILRDLQAVPSSVVIATDWQRQPNAQMRRLIQSKRRHFFNSKTSLVTHLSATSASSKDALVDTAATAHVDALGACLEEMEVNGRHFGEFSLTVVLFDQDFVRLKRSVAECFKVLAAHDGRLIEERYNLLNAWLSVFPGNEAYNLRREFLLNTHHADLSFLFAPETGNPVNAHLGQEHLAVLESEDGTPFYLNLHVQDVAHTLVLGATGSGKSFLLNFLITFLQKYTPRTLIFDLGGSYRRMTQAFGGAYVPISETTASFSINPFCLEPTLDHLHFLAAFVRVLIESSGYAMSAEDEIDLTQQIEALYAIDPGERRLLTLSRILKRSLRTPLDKWVSGGPYARWFDNASDTVTLATFQTFDFEGMSDYPQVLEPLVFYILHRASVALNDPAASSVFKVFVLDEAWRFFRHPAIKRYAIEAAKTWRKKNAALILATQSADDLRDTQLLPALIESCPTQLFLANPGMDTTLYREIFQLNEVEAERIAQLIPKKQILVRQPSLSKVVNLNVDAMSHALFASHHPEGAMPS